MVLEELLKEYGDKVRVVLKHMVVHPDTVMGAHLASCAAAKQGKFKEFYKAFWERSFKPYMESQGKDKSKLGEETFLGYASELGLNVDRMKQDMNGECRQIVAADEAELRKFRVSGTPAFFINGQLFPGGMPKENFKQVIDQKLKEVQASGVAPTEYYEKVIMATGDKAFRSRRKQPTQ